MKYHQSNTLTPSASTAIPQNGPLLIPMTNDYLFRALLQRNNNVLKGLISSLLHLDPSEVSSVVITNPIELGNAIDDKTFILDISIILNHSTVINLEMQVVNLHNWPDRSLSYLCRRFDQLKKGNNYETIQPVIQIGLLNFSLFPDRPEFYATYQFLNVKTHFTYSDKLRLSVLDLTRIDLATEEDQKFQIDYWASLFKATTWEELCMLAKNNQYIQEASETVYELTQEEKIRLQCEAREDYFRTMNGMNNLVERSQKALSESQAALAENQAALTKAQTALSEKDDLIAALKAELQQYRKKESSEEKN